MKIDILTIFPDFFRGPLDYGIVRKAREAGLAEIEVHDLRAFARDRHRTVDDRPFGGGEGMVLKPEPIFECIEGLKVQSRAQRVAGAGSKVWCYCRRRAAASTRGLRKNSRPWNDLS